MPVDVMPASPGIRQLLDERGRPLGGVVQPRDPDLVGQGRGTILLQRPAPGVAAAPRRRNG